MLPPSTYNLGMAHSETWARRLLREMPRDPEELLEVERYRDPTFLRIFLDHVDDVIYRDPRAGLKLARVAPRLAELVPEGRGRGSRRRHREWLIRAHATLGGAYRATGRLDAAESEYALALRIADSLRISPPARANLCRRLAVLRACQKRYVEALELADEAAEIFRGRKDRQGLAAAIATRGYVLNEEGRFADAIPYHGEALRIAGEALRVAGRKRPAALVRVHQVARVNLADALAQSSGAEAAAEALDQAREAGRALRGQRRCRARHHCQWIEGKAWLRLGLDRRAEQSLKVARRGFVRLDAPWEIALVSLELAAIYRLWGQWEDLETLAEDTFRRFRELSGDYEAISALSLWLDAVRARKGAAAAIDAAQRTVQARMPRS